MSGFYFLVIFSVAIIIIYFYFRNVAIAEKEINNYIERREYYNSSKCILSYLYSSDDDNKSIYHFKMTMYAYEKGLLFIRDKMEALGPYSIYFANDLTDIDKLKKVDLFLIVNDFSFLKNSIGIEAKPYFKYFKISQTKTYYLELLEPSVDFERLTSFLIFKK